MMLKFSKLIRMLKGGNRLKIGNPVRDWQIIVGCFLVAILLIVSWSVYLFVSVNVDDGVDGDKSAHIENIDKKALDALTAESNKKKAAFEAFKLAKPDVVDPSL
jgi:hypothetical protein